MWSCDARVCLWDRCCRGAQLSLLYSPSASKGRRREWKTLCLGLIWTFTADRNMMNCSEPFCLINPVVINVLDLFPVCFLTDCSHKQVDRLLSYPLCLSLSVLLPSAIFTCITLFFYFYTVTTHFTTSRWLLSPLLLSTNSALCVSLHSPRQTARETA